MSKVIATVLIVAGIASLFTGAWIVALVLIFVGGLILESD